MDVATGGGSNPLRTTVMVTLFSYPLCSQEKGGFCARKHRHTPTVRDGSGTVAAGHTSGGTVGQWTRVGEGKMNQVAQHRLMISQGIGGGSKYPSCPCH